MSSRADNPLRTRPVSAGVYCHRCGTVLALASLDDQPVCHLCLFGAAKEQDLAYLLRKVRPLPLLGGPVKARPDKTDASPFKRLA